MELYCAYDHFNPSYNRTTGEIEHACDNYDSVLCNKCNSRYDGDKIHEYMENNPREH